MGIERITSDLNKTCVLTKTKIEFDLVRAKLNELGTTHPNSQWDSGYTEKFCFDLMSIAKKTANYSGLDWFKGKNYTILEAADFLLLIRDEQVINSYPIY